MLRSIRFTRLFSLKVLELILSQGTVVLDVLVLNGSIPTRQSGWKFETEDVKNALVEVGILDQMG